MNQLGGFPLLTLILFLPVVGAAVSLLIPRDRPELLRWLALLMTSTDLFITLFLYMAWVNDPPGGFQFVDGPWPWIAGLGLSYHLAIDGLNVHLVSLTALLMVLVQIAGWLQWGEASRRITFWTFLLQAGLLGALLAANLALLACFWTLAILAAGLLVGQQSNQPGPARWTLAGAVLVGGALFIVTAGVVAAGGDLNLTTATTLPVPVAYALFWPALLACAITAAAAPLHAWYPAVQRTLPFTTRILLGGLLLNLGSYGLIRLCLGLLIPAAIAFITPLRVLGLLGLWYGALIAMRQQNVSDALAYWNVARAGLVLAGVFALSYLALYGVILHMLGSSLVVAALLLMCRREQPPDSTTSRIGLGLRLLSAAGVLGLSSFVGTSTLILGMTIPAFYMEETNPSLWFWTYYAAAGLGVLTGAWALIRAWRMIPRPTDTGRPTQQMWVALPLLLLLLLLGLAPGLMSAPIEPTVYRLLMPALELLNR